MKIWKLFFIFQLSYIGLVYLIILMSIIIGLGFFQNVPLTFSTMTRIVLYPMGPLIKLFAIITTKQINHFVLVIIASAIVSSIITTIIVVIKVLLKKF